MTATGVGTAIITATSMDGECKDWCQVTILAPEIMNTFVINNNINVSDIQCTDDGLFIMTVPLSCLFIKNNIHYLYEDVGDEKKRDVTKYYDDWYLFALKNNGKIKYGLYKMREQEHDYTEGTATDLDDPGVTISFVELSSNLFIKCLNCRSKENTYNLLQNLNKVTGPEVCEHDEDITDYFAKTESKGAYLIAEEFVNFIAQVNENNIISVPNKYIDLLENIKSIDEQLKNVWLDNESRLVLINKKNKLMRIPDWLVDINKRAGYDVYDSDSCTIRIQNKNCLNIYEKYAILATFTADLTFNMFAAEVEFHADAVSDWKAEIPWIGNIWYKMKGSDWANLLLDIFSIIVSIVLNDSMNKLKSKRAKLRRLRIKNDRMVKIALKHVGIRIRYMGIVINVGLDVSEGFIRTLINVCLR